VETEGLAQICTKRGIVAGIAFDRQTIQDAEMKTLWLRTVNEDPVYEDSNKQATLDSTKGPCIEAREGEHSSDKTEAIRKAASEGARVQTRRGEDRQDDQKFCLHAGNI
jgi:hypothetical protein